MQPVLFDTSIYITVLRLGPEAALGLRRMAAGGAVWLSSVVLEELYAGASTCSRHVVERLERDFHRARRILVPNLTDWTQTGKGRLTNDSLIAMSAGRLGITVITANARDFAKLAVFRPFQWRVEKPDA